MGEGGLDGWTQDVRHAVRALLGRPVTTGMALLTLALGIGAGTAMFSVFRSVLLRPLPFPEPDELVAFREVHEGRERHASPAGYLDWRRRASSFEAVTAYDDRTFVLRAGGEPQRVSGAWVSGNFFATLGVGAAVGHAFDPALRADGSAPEAVLGHGLWVERFGGDPGVVGRTLRVDGTAVRVLGVAPRGFSFPEGASLWLRSPWEAPPVGGLGPELPDLRNAWYFRVVGRLADGVGLEGAREEMAAIDARIARESPADAPDGGTLLRPLLAEMAGDSGPLLSVLLGAVGVLLLTGCANLASLSLARVSDREGELAVRVALGAGRWRLGRLVLVEALVLSAAGGVLGVALAAWGLPALRPLLPATLPRLGEIRIDGTVLAVALLVTTLTAVLFGFLPALRAAGRAGGSTLRARGGTPGPGRLRDAVVAGEVAASLVLVAAAALLVRSLAGMASVDPGFAPGGLATLRATLPDAGGASLEARRAGWEAIEAAAAAVPGVSRAALSAGEPTGTGPRATLRIRTPEGVVEGPDVEWQPTTPGWHATAGIHLLRGRLFDASDVSGSPDVAVVSRSLARAAFGEAGALGRRVTIGLDGHDRPLTVVGVVEDTRNRGPATAPLPVLYRPLAQVARPGTSWTVAVRVPPGSEAASVGRLRSALRRARPDAVLHGEATGPELLAVHSAEHRFVLGLLASFGGLALFLGGVGVYGVAASSVARRRREVGVRMAVGAGRLGVIGLVLRRGMVPVAAGLALGIPASWLTGGLLGGLLYGVEPGDPVVTLAVSAVLIGVAGLALAAPSLRAASLDPATVLRES